MGIHNDSGVSLIEFMVAIAVTTILSVIGVKQYVTTYKSFDRQSALRILDTDLRRARAEAMARGSRTFLDFSEDGTTYTVNFDLQPYTDPPAVSETILTRQLPENVSVTISPEIIFDSRGFLIDPDGVPQNVSVTINYDGNTYFNGTIYPIGALINDGA